jgi:hypothetical protein
MTGARGDEAAPAEQHSPPRSAEVDAVIARFAEGGARMTEWDGSVATMESDAGPFAAAFVHVEGWPNRHAAGLAHALAGALGGRRFQLHVRKPLPEEFDVAPVLKAVGLWVAAIERGDWQGLQAVYDDGPVCVDISLIDREGGPGGPNLVFGPRATIERLSRLDEAIMDVGIRVGSFGNPPVVVVALGAMAPRGYLQQFLYGTADWTEVSEGGRRMGVSPNGRSLFADPAAHGVGALLWWGEAARLWVNPWSRSGGFDPPGDWFGLRVEERVAGNPMVTMRWGPR